MAGLPPLLLRSDSIPGVAGDTAQLSVAFFRLYRVKGNLRHIGVLGFGV